MTDFFFYHYYYYYYFYYYYTTTTTTTAAWQWRGSGFDKPVLSIKVSAYLERCMKHRCNPVFRILTGDHPKRDLGRQRFTTLRHLSIQVYA